MSERRISMLVKWVKFDRPWTTVQLEPTGPLLLDTAIRGELTIASNKVGELDDYKVGRHAELILRPIA